MEKYEIFCLLISLDINNQKCSFVNVISCSDKYSTLLGVPFIITVRLIMESVAYLIELTVSHRYDVLFVGLDFEHHLTDVFRI